MQNNALDPGLVMDDIDQRISNVVEINGDLWVAQTVLDSTNTSVANPNGTDAIAWWEISLASDTVIQGGLISSKGTSNPNLYFFFPSIAVNAADDVVIGFEGSGTTQFISSYTAVGTTNLGVTTFTVPALLKSGQGVFIGDEVGESVGNKFYNGLAAEPGPIGPVATPAGPTGATANTPTSQVQDGGLDVVLWGGYSATAIDPTNPDEFWTFQSFANAQSSGDTQTWGVQATRVTVDLPAVSLSVSGPLPVSTPQALGIVGDDLERGDRQRCRRFAELGHSVARATSKANSRSEPGQTRPRAGQLPRV